MFRPRRESESKGNRSNKGDEVATSTCCEKTHLSAEWAILKCSGVSRRRCGLSLRVYRTRGRLRTFGRASFVIERSSRTCCVKTHVSFDCWVSWSETFGGQPAARRSPRACLPHTMLGKASEESNLSLEEAPARPIILPLIQVPTITIPTINVPLIYRHSSVHITWPVHSPNAFTSYYIFPIIAGGSFYTILSFGFSQIIWAF